jgi:hypothetical protein
VGLSCYGIGCLLQMGELIFIDTSIRIWLDNRAIASLVKYVEG